MSRDLNPAIELALRHNDPLGAAIVHLERAAAALRCAGELAPGWMDIVIFGYGMGIEGAMVMLAQAINDRNCQAKTDLDNPSGDGGRL